MDVDVSGIDPYMIVELGYECFLEAEPSVGCNNEFEKYLNKNREGRKDSNFDIFLWWKNNSSRY